MSRWIIINKDTWINLDSVQLIQFTEPPPDTKHKYKIELFLRKPISTVIMEVENEEDHMLLEVPIDNGDGSFIFVDFNLKDVSSVRPSKNWPSTFKDWQRFIKYVFNKDLPKPSED